MADKELQEVETEFTIKDTTTSALAKISGAAGKVSNQFNRISSSLGGIASLGAVIGGGLGFVEAIHGVNEYLGAVAGISKVTGTATERASGLLDAFEEVGIEGESAERILLGMSRKTAMVETNMKGVGQATGGSLGLLRKLGVNLDKGIVPAMIRMSELTKKSKIRAGELRIAFGIPR